MLFTSHKLNGLDIIWIDTHVSMFSQLTGNIEPEFTCLSKEAHKDSWLD